LGRCIFMFSAAALAGLHRHPASAPLFQYILGAIVSILQIAGFYVDAATVPVVDGFCVPVRSGRMEGLHV
jgi:hypothetical protein